VRDGVGDDLLSWAKPTGFSRRAKTPSAFVDSPESEEVEYLRLVIGGQDARR
jgi:hypothetical protein